MDATEVAAALRGAAERGGGCVLAAIRNGWESCLDESCVECAAESVRWFSEAADAIERCALPEGVSWPRFEDGRLVRIGDRFVTKVGDVDRLCQVFLGEHGFSLCGEESEDCWAYGERVKPEPPDTWERIEEDVALSPRKYLEASGIERKEHGTAAQQCADLVRRCRALAERERGE